MAADTPEAHYNLAIVLASTGQTADAEREYRAALRLWPRSIQARHNLALLLAQQGQLAEAAAELETLIAADPVPASAFALGLLYGQMGRWQDAAQALARCVEEDPSYPRARYNRALALAKAGDTTAALDELERAAEIPPRTPRRCAPSSICRVRSTTRNASSAGSWRRHASTGTPPATPEHASCSTAERRQRPRRGIQRGTRRRYARYAVPKRRVSRGSSMRVTHQWAPTKARAASRTSAGTSRQSPRPASASRAPASSGLRVRT